MYMCIEFYAVIITEKKCAFLNLECVSATVQFKQRSHSSILCVMPAFCSYAHWMLCFNFHLWQNIEQCWHCQKLRQGLYVTKGERAGYSVKLHWPASLRTHTRRKKEGECGRKKSPVSLNSQHCTTQWMAFVKVLRENDWMDGIWN